MRKILLIVFVLVAAAPAFSQDDSKADKQSKNKEILSRAGDHIMLQFSSDHWMGTPDSISNHMKGFSRGLNAAIMLNKPFKGDPRFSVAFGVGFSSSSMFFKKMNVDIISNDAKLPFTALDNSDHFKKYKLSTSFLEVPIEFRFTANPYKPNKSIKVALGAKVGTMLNAHTKAKNLQDATDQAVKSYTEKITNKTYFNTTRLAATARIGYGNFSIFGSYGITPIFKDAVAADIKLFQVGLTFSGL